MQRRSFFRALTLAGLAGLAPRGANARDDAARATSVVYHLSDADKAAFVLGNLENHRAGGPPGLRLAAVVHGTALPVFRLSTPNAELKRAFAAALADGVAFYACANTLRAHEWTLADLMPGFLLAPEGGVTKLADLQAQGWTYLRP
jgi:intracellular sulfur oxidation DsrE/DsrF family protein